MYLFIRAVSRFSHTTNYFANRSLVFEKPYRILCRRAGSLQRALHTGKERKVVHTYWGKQLRKENTTQVWFALPRRWLPGDSRAEFKFTLAEVPGPVRQRRNPVRFPKKNELSIHKQLPVYCGRVGA